MPGAIKKNGVWKVPVSADAQLGDAALPQIDRDDFLGMTEKKRTAALKRAGLIVQFEKFSGKHVRGGGLRTEAMEVFCHKENIPVSTFKRWIKNYSQSGLIGLADHRGGDRCGESISEGAWEYFKSLYLDSRQPSIRQCYRIVSLINKTEGYNWIVPEYKAFCRYIKKHLPIPVQVLHRNGEAAYDAQCGPFIQLDLTKVDPGSWWVGDHHQCNVFVRYKDRWVRPWLTCWQDLRSRAAVGWWVCDLPNQTTILRSFRRGVAAYGPPESVKIDNGKDYDSELFTGTTKHRKKVLRRGYLDESLIHGIYSYMGIDASFAIPYHPQSKVIERLFGTFDEQFCKTFATYTGKDADRKPEDLINLLKDPEVIASGPDLTRFQELVSEWFSVYNQRPHSALDGKAPLEVLNSRQTKRILQPGVLDLLLRVWSGKIRVSKNGVRLKGLYYGQFNPVIMQHVGKDVRVSFDPDDLSHIYVYDSETLKLLTIAEQNQLIAYGGKISDTNLREAMRQKARAKKIIKGYKNASLVSNSDLVPLAIKSLAEEARQTEAACTKPNIKPVRTIFDNQIKQHRRCALRQAVRRAAGSEQVSFVPQLDFDFDVIGAEKEPSRSPMLTWDWDESE